MAVYVSLPQIPLNLRFEEPFEDVVDRFQKMISGGEVCRFDHTEGVAVVVNFAVQASAFIGEGHSVTGPSDLPSAVRVPLPPFPE